MLERFESSERSDRVERPLLWMPPKVRFLLMSSAIALILVGDIFVLLDPDSSTWSRIVSLFSGLLLILGVALLARHAVGRDPGA